MWITLPTPSTRRFVYRASRLCLCVRHSVSVSHVRARRTPLHFHVSSFVCLSCAHRIFFLFLRSFSSSSRRSFVYLSLSLALSYVSLSLVVSDFHGSLFASVLVAFISPHYFCVFFRHSSFLLASSVPSSPRKRSASIACIFRPTVHFNP